MLHKNNKNVFVFLSNQKMLTVAAEIPKKNQKSAADGEKCMRGFFHV